MSYWYALYTKPRKEQQVDALLKELGIDTYLPTYRRKVRRRDRPDRVVFFPCYLFAFIDFDATPRSTIDWLPGIRRIVCAGDQPAIVAEEIVALIRRRLRGAEEIDIDNYRQGDRVRITTGPLRNLEAVFDQSLSSADRVRILLDVVGRMTAVDIDRSEIVRV